MWLGVLHSLVMPGALANMADHAPSDPAGIEYFTLILTVK